VQGTARTSAGLVEQKCRATPTGYVASSRLLLTLCNAPEFAGAQTNLPTIAPAGTACRPLSVDRLGEALYPRPRAAGTPSGSFQMNLELKRGLSGRGQCCEYATQPPLPCRAFGLHPIPCAEYKLIKERGVSPAGARASQESASKIGERLRRKPWTLCPVSVLRAVVLASPSGARLVACLPFGRTQTQLNRDPFLS
jgi:hypothetical protein